MMKRLGLLAAAIIISLLLAFGGSYLMVVSQNPSSNVQGSLTDYGPVQPAP